MILTYINTNILLLFSSSRYSSCKAFKIVLNEINDLAGQHEVVSENLHAIVIKELHALIKDLREERKVIRSYLPLVSLFILII